MAAAPRKRGKIALRASPRVLGASEAEQVIFSAWREDDLLNYVVRTARTTNWLCYHTRYSLKSAAGFPDIVAVHRTEGRLLLAELKREGLLPTESRFSPAGQWVTGQREWLEAFARGGGYESYLWWPSDARDIADILTTGPRDDMPCVVRLKKYLAVPTP